MTPLKSALNQTRLNATAVLNFKNKAFAVNGNTYTPDENKAFFTFTMLHSWPVINGNGMSFAAKTIQRSFQTAQFNQVNFEHQSEGNGITLWDGSKIIGTMIDAGFEVNDDGIAEMVVVGVLWKREPLAMEIINDMATGGKEWKISMEVLYDERESGFMVASEDGDSFIPLSAAPDTLIEAFDNGWGKWDGKKYGFMLGGTGEEGDPDEANVNFWGSALTLTPADPNATIRTLVASSQRPAIAADQYKFIIASDGTPESTRLIVDGAEVNDLRDVEFMSWPGWDDLVYLWWSVAADKQDGVERNQSFVYTGASMEETAMSGILELLNGLPAAMASAIEQARKEAGDGEVNVEDVINSKIEEVKTQFANYVSPDEVDAKVAERVEEEVKAREATASKIAEREQALADENIPLTKARKDAIAKFETEDDEGFTNWLNGLKEGFAAMREDLESEHIEVTEEVESQIASYDGVESEGFKATKSALAMARKVPGIFADFSGAGEGDDPPSKTPNKPSGLV